jgi:DNA repair protein RadC
VIEGIEKEKFYLGHRERMRKKILSDVKLLDYELLELLLFNVFPRKDVKVLAKKIILECGGFSNTFFSDYNKLKKIDGIGDSVIAMLFTIKEIFIEILYHDVRKSDNLTLNGMKEILNYLRIKIGKNSNESFCVLYLDKAMKLLYEEVQENGTIDQVTVYNREIVRKALECGATNLVLSHNHPSGNATPSKADIDHTLQLRNVCNSIGIKIVDHLIVTSTNAHCSFYKEAIL